MTRRVAIFLNQCLPISEIFVRHQVEGLTRFKAQFVACRRVTPSVAGDITQTVLNESGSKFAKLKELFFKLFRRSKILEDAVAGCDVVHAHFGPTGWLVARIAKRLGKPLVVSLHGFDVLKRDISLRRDGLLQKVYYLNRRQLAKDADVFICVSDYIKTRAVEFGFPQEKCIVHYMGTPLIEHKAPKHARRNVQPIRLLAVGRLVPFKAHSKLIEAISLVEEKGHMVELNIIGEGSLRDQLEAQAASSLKNYKFWGAQPHDKVLELMRSSDIFCHTSMHMPNGQTEAFGLVVLEAQWAGLPAVVFNSGGVPEAIDDGRSGYMVPEGDVDAFAEAVCKLIEEPEVCQNMSEHAIDFVRSNFDCRVQGQKLEEIYMNMLRNRRSA